MRRGEGERGECGGRERKEEGARRNEGRERDIIVYAHKGWYRIQVVYTLSVLMCTYPTEERRERVLRQERERDREINSLADSPLTNTTELGAPELLKRCLLRLPWWEEL